MRLKKLNKIVNSHWTFLLSGHAIHEGAASSLTVPQQPSPFRSGRADKEHSSVSAVILASRVSSLCFARFSPLERRLWCDM
jgi:hypothetical protein